MSKQDIIDNDINQELAADGRQAGIEEEPITPFPFDADRISISNKPVPLQTLVRRLEQGTISSPLIQRGEGIWNDGQQSRLIESLMLKIPLPLFYVAADEDEKWKVVDGLQRVTAIRRFVLTKEFALTDLEFIRELNGKKFNELPQKYQNRIFETEFTFAIINPVTPPEVQRNIFKRLNTGGLPLTPQEIRHALYYGRSAELLKELVCMESFKKATDYRVNDSRMGARELILRFISFLIRGTALYPKNEDMDAFLCETMQLINLMPDFDPADIIKAFGDRDIVLKVNYDNNEDIHSRFETAMCRAYALFNIHAFRKSTPRSNYRTPVNKSLFEAWSVVLAEMEEETYLVLKKRKNKLYQEINSRMYDLNQEFERSISRDSHKPSGVRARYRIINEIVKKIIEE
ncbi:MAG: DUF262 domain-containing protein [Proteobacteria bacterium]|nr:DUF262 domain-containing protein [Pseudomonadota bacterium]MBU1649279.1 DUF262 domain-containing protein [Pseudomonadota bacterium]